ncbi:MAG: hypothetical protein LQ352_002520 [Teloschistes flavicans]|nr:MAG: hypothetical protein LQ352_002520 [Teloschistes flavicans]
MEDVDSQNLVDPDDLNGFYLNLIVPKDSVKMIKNALESRHLFDKSLKITPFTCNQIEKPFAPLDELQAVSRALENRSLHRDIDVPIINRTRGDYAPNPYRPVPPDQQYVVPTTFEVRDSTRQKNTSQANHSRDTILQEIGLANRTDIEAQLTYRRHPAKRLEGSENSILAQAVRKWLVSLPSSIRSSLPGDPNILLGGCKWTYTIYTPMLLLPPTFLSKKPWSELLEGALKPHVPELHSIICERLKVTHIAVNGPIPAVVPSMSPLHDDAQSAEPNILRSPNTLVPLHGDFGKPKLPPREQNLKEAFWVSTVQNDITQTWAPLYTMFSRGNLSEKTRLLTLDSVKTAAAAGCSAVDMYAGIGYFAFSYLKAGIAKVFCWDVNRWSLEGLRRGAGKNGWAVGGIDDTDVESELTYSHDDHEEKLSSLGNRVFMFHESNKFAARTFGSLKGRIPPIRHVNCGYLPSSSDCWHIAVLVLDDKEGGWVHAHENVPIKDIKTRRHEVVEIFEKLVEPYRKENEILSRFTVGCFHVERVKTYAPGIMHCVFDVSVMPRKI